MKKLLCGLNRIRNQIVTRIFQCLGRNTVKDEFHHSKLYWQERYAQGGNSGEGSYGQLAKYKANFVKNILASYDIESVIEFGCGDGNQLSLVEYPRYLGLDVSETAISRCRKKFHKKRNYTFELMDNYSIEYFDLALSLDVIYHLVEDDVFDRYMVDLFSSASKYVLIYSSDFDTEGNAHVRHRKFSNWVSTQQPDFQLISYEKNPFNTTQQECKSHPLSSADFFFFVRN